MNQAELVMNHLLTAGDISGLEADSLYRIVDLPKRISELRQAGHGIDGEWRRDATGKKYMRYSMPMSNHGRQ